MVDEGGFSLLEMLLVLAIVTGILLFSVNRYLSYERETKTQGVKSDISRIQQRLNEYYHRMGCTKKGTFAGNLNPTVVKDLNFPRDKRAPLVTRYSAKIIPTEVTSEKGKIVYQLEVSAELSSDIKDSDVAWYQQVLGAGKRLGKTLTWRALPNSLISEPGVQALWPFNQTLDQFKQLESGASDTNCAH